MNAMLTDKTKRKEILTAITDVITGAHGRVVPVKTNLWAGELNGFPTAPNQDARLDKYCSEPWLVRETTGFNAEIGAGLFGVSGKNDTNYFHDHVKRSAPRPRPTSTQA